MSQPGESEIQATPARTVIKKKIIVKDSLDPRAGHNDFLFYGGSKRKVARLLVDYVEEALGEFTVHLRENMPENLYLRSVKEAEIASLWWEEDTTGRIHRLREKLGDHYEQYIWDYGVYDATLLIPVEARNTANGYKLIDAIMRDCWECRHKKTAQEKRKKIKEMSPLMREFYDYADDFVDDDNGIYNY